MAKDGFRTTQGWVSVITGVTAFGIIIGLTLMSIIGGEDSIQYLYISIIAGMFIGILIARRINKKTGMGKWFQPPNSSADMDDFRDIFIDKNENREYIEILPELTDEELLLSLTWQYYLWIEPTRQIVFSEIFRRNISKEQLGKYYKTLHVKELQSGKECPRCNSKKYYRPLTKESFERRCLLCGYDSVMNNPSSLTNRMKKLSGTYDDQFLTFQDIESLYEQYQGNLQNSITPSE